VIEPVGVALPLPPPTATVTGKDSTVVMLGSEGVTVTPGVGMPFLLVIVTPPVPLLGSTG
jgi:hypothetical protein